VYFLRAIQDPLFDAAVDLTDHTGSITPRPNSRKTSCEGASCCSTCMRHRRARHGRSSSTSARRTSRSIRPAVWRAFIPTVLVKDARDSIKNWGPKQPLNDRSLLPEGRGRDGVSFTKPQTEAHGYGDSRTPRRHQGQDRRPRRLLRLHWHEHPVRRRHRCGGPGSRQGASRVSSPTAGPSSCVDPGQSWASTDTVTANRSRGRLQL